MQKPQTKTPLPSLTKSNVVSFVSHMLPLPDIAVHSKTVSVAEAVLSNKKAVDRTRYGQVMIDALQDCKSAVTMMVTPLCSISSSHCSISELHINNNSGAVQHCCHIITGSCII